MENTPPKFNMKPVKDGFQILRISFSRGPFLGEPC